MPWIPARSRDALSPRRAGVPALLVLALAGASACDDGDALEPAGGPVALRVRAVAPDGDLLVALKTGSRVALVASPVTADSALAGAPIAATWRSTDTTAVRVDAGGVVTGLAPGTRATVGATVVVGGRTLTGSVQVLVLDPTPARSSHVLIAGQVRTADGAIVPGASVAIRPGIVRAPGECLLGLQGATVATDASGAYVWRLLGGPMNETVCALLDVAPPPGSALQATTVRTPDVTLVSTDATPPVSWRLVVLPR